MHGPCIIGEGTTLSSIDAQVKQISAAAGSADSRDPAIRLELFSAIMHSYRALPVFFPVVTAALALTFEPAVPAWVVVGWWLIIVAIHVEYHFYQHRYFDAVIAPDDVNSWIKATAARYWLMNIVWLGLFPLFWNSGGDIQNFAILMVFVVHVVMASQTAFHLTPITISVTLPIMAGVIGMCISTFETAYLALGIGCTPTYLYLMRLAQHQRKAAVETLDLRLRNADLIRDLGQARDVSEEARRQAEEANDQLKRREHHFRALVENAFDVVLVTDEKAIIQYASPAAAKLGLEPGALIGMNSLEFLTDRQRNEVLGLASSSESGATTSTYELVVPDYNGKPLWIEATLTNLLNDENVHGYVINLRDITQRKRAETEQRSQFQVLQALATGEPLTEVMTRLALGAEETNPGARAAVFLLDGTRDLVTSAAPSLPDDFNSWIGEFWKREKEGFFGLAALSGTRIVVTNLQDKQHGEFVSSYMRKAGIQTLWFQPIVSHNGSVIGSFALYFPTAMEPGEQENSYLAGVAHLCSIAIERRRSEESLRRATESAELANRAKTKFLANMSHELRTPLNAIIGFSEIMRQQMFGPLGTERYIEYTNDIHDSGRHLLNVIDDILDISKIEAGRYAIEEEEIDFAGVLRWSIEMMRARTIEKEQTITLSLPDEMPQLRADQRAMRQVMLNLLSNASKFTPVGGQIDLVSAIDDRGNLSLSVSDNGIGIPADKLQEVLEPFGQVDDTNARQHGGTGLGLPITKSLIEMHGGEFVPQSDLGRGTTAIMTLPGWRLVWLGTTEKAATPGT
jgi:PAS domain S-box-containing protein